ncbi:MAG: phosphatidate cytidylyltransferase [Flavobacteriales bacterium]|nr:phosphatidate cytidylyltransferase [Flavobacteriales bacterium]
MKEIGVRALTGAVYVALTLGAAWAGSFTTALLYFPVCLLALRELHLLSGDATDDAALTWALVSGAAVYGAVAAGAFLPAWSIGYTIAVGFLMVLLAIAWALLHGQPDPMAALGGTLTATMLVAVPFGLLPHFFTFGPWALIGFMILLWTNDTGAYLVGRAIGRTKLLPAVSPKKTVEGLVGGIALTLGMAWLYGRYNPELRVHEWLAVGGIIALTSTLGDLLESAFKRARGVKDSGTLLPGHGGILDRFDGFLLAVPAVMLYLHLMR